MLPLHTRASVSGNLAHPLLKVLDLGEALQGAIPFDRVAVHLPPGNRSPPLRSNCDRNREVMQVRSGAGESVSDV
jgi:hypothetical protein